MIRRRVTCVLAACLTGLVVVDARAATAGDAVAAATRPAATDELKTARDTARAYFSLIKAELPRAAIATYFDFDRFGRRCFGADWDRLSEVERRETTEALRAVLYIGFADPRVGEMMSHATFDNFAERPAADGNGADVEFDMSGGPIPKSRNRLRLELVEGHWKIVDMWNGSQAAGEGIAVGYRQVARRIGGALMYTRAMLDPRPAPVQQQQQAGPGQPQK